MARPVCAAAVEQMRDARQRMQLNHESCATDQVKRIHRAVGISSGLYHVIPGAVLAVRLFSISALGAQSPIYRHDTSALV